MWKRDEPVKPAGSPSSPAPAQTAGAHAEPASRPATPDAQRGLERAAVNIGKSVVIKGELNGSEDLTIEGQVEGKIELRQNVLTIGPNARIKAQVFAKSVIILGEIVGNVSATDKVDIRDNGSVDGDISAPRVAIAEGAHFRGSIDMQRGDKGKQAESKASESKPAAQPAAAQQSAAPAGAGR